MTRVERLREWIGSHIVLFGARVMGGIELHPIEEARFPEPDDDDDVDEEEVVYPRVTLNEHAKGMIFDPDSLSRPEVVEKPKPLKGSLADRFGRR